MREKHLIFPLALLALLSISCSKTDNQQSGEENFYQHLTWTDDNHDAFWDKQQEKVFQVGTVWDGDTTISF